MLNIDIGQQTPFINICVEKLMW